ncbi:zinc-ribbon domain-containing protein [Candidatus Bathyarchaeota archaeon]|nr:MAG: zinc-ribbon domain-containing protein [Candidatus Bathyarchaeota archaeon]
MGSINLSILNYLCRWTPRIHRRHFSPSLQTNPSRRPTTIRTQQQYGPPPQNYAPPPQQQWGQPQQPITRICPNCGRVVQENLKFCPNCGKQLN